MKAVRINLNVIALITNLLLSLLPFKIIVMTSHKINGRSLNALRTQVLFLSLGAENSKYVNYQIGYLIFEISIS